MVGHGSSRDPPFAQLLRRYRRERGLTQEALAEVAGLSARGIRALEQAERTAPHTDTVRLLADALQLSPSDRATFEDAARHLWAGRAARDIAPPPGSFLGALPSGVLVARTEELKRVITMVDAVEGGSGRLILLAGEPGVGKTRLAQEVMLRLEERGFLIATGRCYQPEQAVPYYPFVEALAAAYEAAPVTLQSEVPRRWPYVEWLLPDRPSVIRADEVDRQDVQQRFFWAVAHFLGALAEIRPLAVLLDDLQWADESSLKLFQYAARASRAHRIFLLGTYRDVDIDRRHPLDRVLRDLHREGLLTEMVIRRLPQEGTAALTAAMLGEVDMSEAFVALLHARTDGNPFFTQEVVRALIERGDLFVADGVWRSQTEAEIEVPRSIRSAIGERLARLSEPAQEVLSEASVLGQTFAFRDLGAMRGRPREHVDDALDDALMASLIRITDKERFSFNHALTQQTLYEELPVRRRTRLHLLAAEALERLPDATRRKRAPELVWHFLQADEGTRALPYAMVAGDQAEAVFAHTEALQHYRTALELAHAIHDRPREAEALEKLGVLLRFGTHYDQAHEVLERAVAAYRAIEDPEGEARATRQIGAVLFFTGQPTEGIARVRATVERLERMSGPASSRALAYAYWALAVQLVPTGEYGDILAASARIAELGQAANDARAMAAAAWLRGLGLCAVGSPGEARRSLEAALPFFTSSGDKFQLAQVTCNIGRTYLHEGNVDRATAYLQQTLELFEVMGDQAELAWASCYTGDVAFVTGDWAEARRHYERSAALARTTVPRYHSHALLHLAELSLLEEATEQGMEDIKWGLAVAEQCSEVAAIRKAGRLLAEQDLAAGDAEAALARLQPLLDGLGQEAPHAFPPPVLAEAYLATGDEVRADELVAGRIERFRRQHRRRSLADWLRIQGKVRVRQGRSGEAQQAYEEAASLAHALPYPHAEATALFESGILHSHNGEVQQARERLEEALAIFRHLAARPHIKQTEDALHDLA
jgi:tetratricopeptide (TPR) repeat protein/transcriptional regulator with XRE-family HTH domain